MGYDLRPMTEPTNDPLLRALRVQIAAADRDLVGAFARRLSVAREITRLKDERDYAFVDPEREKQLLEEWRSSSAGEISDDTLLELFEKVLTLSKRESQRDAG